MIFNQKKYLDYDIEVLTSNLNQTGHEKYKLGTEVIKDVKVRRVKALKIKNQYIPLSKKVFDKINCDVLHLHHFGTIFCEVPLILNENIAVVLKADTGKFYPTYNPLKRIEVIRVNVATAFNDREAKILKMTGFSSVVIVPYGVEVDLFREKGKETPPDFSQLTIVARVIPVKNIELAIKAISLVKDVKLNIIGPIDNLEYYRFLKQLSYKLNVTDRVVFKGKIPYNKLPVEYACSYLTLATSIHENAGPASIVESLATGRPVVSVPLELVRNLRKYYARDKTGGIEVVDYNPEKIANKIQELRDNSSKWKKLSKNGIKTVDNISFKHIVKKIDDIYEKLISRKID